MLKTMNQAYMDDLVSNAVSKKHIFGAVLCVEKGDDSLSLISAAGNLKTNRPYFIASVTKLYVTAVLLKLRAENRLQLHDKISKYLSKDILHKLHMINGIDHSKVITIQHLMSNTSGIPDYFTSDVIAELTAGKDQGWGFEKTITSAKQKKPKFIPGKRAHYSDTNYQLLGKIIETITEKDILTVFKEVIFDELALETTYLFEKLNDVKPAPLYFKDKELHLPLYMSSIGPEGGIVSTARESMIFLKAFMSGRFFPKEYFNELRNWKILFGPGLFFYGMGIASQPISIRQFKEGLIGHWGQTGAFSFYHPKTDLYFTGTVNQFYGHRVAAKMMIEVIKMYKSES
ncbi:serine hydrolase domain-containing protein [Bacillus sp. DTU_2020_1000418_1_SI_GHA_SEK_038]|uniref:serine hydrolase domain-containing protein n=1 Tax=Bacillus sp. DTU_2020_1000418_1_SI_GHA_SEK_038 TaxID=3077585 RepID=UPI0028EFB398|nr:serine hydrolase domain-containing protein [Bacillus sp. DTU_2020_1000418_1_SI_GHA_SEK_038]WNS76461.1 serine hydrolase domain-containing protein [Bacillus sp. DTU_2020_1000418_1_SI_GHA_SEK_038]